MNCNPTPAKITQRSPKPPKRRLQWRTTPLLLHFLPIPIRILLPDLLKNNILPRYAHSHNLFQHPFDTQSLPPIIPMTIPYAQDVFPGLDTQCDPRDFIVSYIGKCIADEGEEELFPETSRNVFAEMRRPFSAGGMGWVFPGRSYRVTEERVGCCGGELRRTHEMGIYCPKILNLDR